MENKQKSAAPGTAPPGELPGLSTRDSAGPAFSPMRLVLYPNGAVMNIDRPDMVVGRHSHADVRLHLPDVSRRHCRFVFAEGQWHVMDLQSTNGVFVNETRVERAVLHQRDLIRIGSYTFEVELAAQNQAPVPSGADAGEPTSGMPGNINRPTHAPQRRAS